MLSEHPCSTRNLSSAFAAGEMLWEPVRWLVITSLAGFVIARAEDGDKTVKWLVIASLAGFVNGSSMNR